MPKSRNRKGHKEKSRRRFIRRRDERNRLLNEFKREQQARLEEMKREMEAAKALSDEEE